MRQHTSAYGSIRQQAGDAATRSSNAQVFSLLALLVQKYCFTGTASKLSTWGCGDAVVKCAGIQFTRFTGTEVLLYWYKQVKLSTWGCGDAIVKCAGIQFTRFTGTEVLLYWYKQVN
jgi:hypothetical protein